MTGFPHPRRRRLGIASLFEVMVAVGLLSGLLVVITVLTRSSVLDARLETERLSASDAAARAFSRLEEDAFRSTEARAENGTLLFSGPAGRVEYRVEGDRLLRMAGGRTDLQALRVASAAFISTGDRVIRVRLTMEAPGWVRPMKFETSITPGGEP